MKDIKLSRYSKQCRQFINNNPELAPEKKVEYLSKSIDFFKEETYFDAERYVKKIFTEKNIDISYLQEN